MKFPLLLRIITAIICGIAFGQFMPEALARVFVTFNSLFGDFLGFCIPLIILCLIIPAISELGLSAGRLLLAALGLAYASTLFAGFSSFLICDSLYPHILERMGRLISVDNPSSLFLQPYFTFDMPPIMEVTSALVLAFVVGMGLAYIKSNALKQCCLDARDIIEMVINNVIVPLLPLYIFGLFLNMTVTGQAFTILEMFVRVILTMVVIGVGLLLLYFCVVGILFKRNPFTLMRIMLPAYMTALGTASSAATIPVTTRQVRELGVRDEIANFVVPLCATIHIPGSTLDIVACSMAFMYMTGTEMTLAEYAPFIFMLSITMVAAPGVPGGAIMASLGLLDVMLGFDETMQALMIALYVTIDSFGTACNVTADGVIALTLDCLKKRRDHARQLS
ncbi:MAG: dicarboxylate/amino acid:cation symporter [Bacteroidaceae bacterium]|nr:dicarboxylate/amino acid:cation symporter [Bacteroidaceae bacterium]